MFIQVDADIEQGKKGIHFQKIIVGKLLIARMLEKNAFTK